MNPKPGDRVLIEVEVAYVDYQGKGRGPHFAINRGYYNTGNMTLFPTSCIREILPRPLRAGDTVIFDDITGLKIEAIKGDFAWVSWGDCNAVMSLDTLRRNEA